MATFGVKVIVNSCLLLLMLLEIIPVMGATCGANQAEVTFDGNVTQCCDTCSAGYGAKVECTSDNKTVCEQCVPGYTYSSDKDHHSSCKKCATCGNSPHFVLHPCNRTHNTICGCQGGYYYDVINDVCKMCDPCSAGFGVVRKCSTKHNTLCKRCEENVTYSDTLDWYPCKPCTRCRKNKVVLQSCNVTEDTLCFSITAGHPDTSYNYSEPTIYTDDDDDDGDIIPVYCAVLGLLVVGLLGYVIFKHWIRVRAKRSHKAPCTHEDVEYSKASGADSGVFVDSDSPKSYNYCLSTRVRELPHGKRKELEKILSSPQSDGWKELAKELGYSSQRMAQFEPRAKNDSVSPFKRMLHDWERRDTATTGFLIQSLRHIGRDDAAKVLYYDTAESRSQILSKQNSVV